MKLAVRLLIGVLVLSAVQRAGYAEETPVLQADTAAAAAPEDIEKIIHQIDSVRDYERLYWVLHAAEQQVPPVRAELLKKLDDQMQQLIQAEVEARTATAVSSVQAALAATALPSETPAAQPASTDRPETSDESWKEARQAIGPVRSRHEVETFIGQSQLPSDSKQRMEQMKQVGEMIMGVEDPDERQALRQMYHQRSQEALRKEMETRQAEAQGKFSALSAKAATETPSDPTDAE